jgi:hypothetical protein
MNYFIVGLPRSRTAWLSVFMSQSSQYCLHDGFNGCNNLIEYWDKLEEGGDSSTGLMMIDINRLKPNSPVVIIEKNKLELERCIEWCSYVYGFDAKDHIVELNERLKAIEGLRINQSEINDNLRSIWEYLVDEDWNESYANMKDFNIQVASTEIDIEAAINFKGGL